MAHRIDTSTAQKDKFGVGKNGFTRGNPQTGVPATELDDDYFDMLQEEIVGIVEAAGDTLDKTKRNQLNAALGKLFQNKTAATSALGALAPAANRLPYFTGASGASLTELTTVGRDILASATKAAVLEYLGLGELPDFGTAASKNVGTDLNQIPDMSAFPSSLSSAQSGSGWYRFPTPDGKGLLLQMMLCVSGGAGNANYNFPIPFPNYVYAMAVLPGGSGASVVNGGTLTKTNSQFYTNGAFSFSVIAIGR